MFRNNFKATLRNLFLTVIIGSILFGSVHGQTQTIDTLVDVGGYLLHFHIIKGKGTPILFEAGGGEDASTWKNILMPIAEKTGTTLITYDRTGFGKSTFDTTRHGILNGMKGLEKGLRILGFDGNIILVAHSQGGLYATLYASRHADKVKAAILIDVTTTCFYEKNRLDATQQLIDKKNNDSFKKSRPGVYYQGADFSNNINYIRSITFPETIPVIDFVSDYTPFTNKKDSTDWKRCHKEFVGMKNNRKGIIAYGCGHFIFNDNPPLVIDAIVQAYLF
jgi:pimeloyl-ACP methyl ester carboxylesterase